MINEKLNKDFSFILLDSKGRGNIKWSEGMVKILHSCSKGVDSG